MIYSKGKFQASNQSRGLYDSDIEDVEELDKETIFGNYINLKFNE